MKSLLFLTLLVVLPPLAILIVESHLVLRLFEAGKALWKCKAEAPRPSEKAFSAGVYGSFPRVRLFVSFRYNRELAVVSDSSQAVGPETVSLKARVLLLSPVALAP